MSFKTFKYFFYNNINIYFFKKTNRLFNNIKIRIIILDKQNFNINKFIFNYNINKKILNLNFSFIDKNLFKDNKNIVKY